MVRQQRIEAMTDDELLDESEDRFIHINELMVELKTSLSQLGYDVENCKITRDFLDAGVPRSTLMHIAGSPDNCKSMGLMVGSSVLLSQPHTSDSDDLRSMFDDFMFKITNLHLLDFLHSGKLLLEMYIDADNLSFIAGIDVIGVIDDCQHHVSKEKDMT